MIPFVGFAPDRDPTAPGVITDCTQLIPSERGMKAAPSAVNQGASAVASSIRGATVLVNTSGTRRNLVGTQTKIFELSGTTWTDVSGEVYTGSSENRWSFTQFGNVAVASNDTEAIATSTSGNFAFATGAPEARIIVSIPNFVVALNTNDGSLGDRPDGWWTCQFQDPTTWTLSASLQAVAGRLVEGGGEITAGLPFGTGLIVFKSRAMFQGIYVGPPAVLQFDRIPGEQGCVGPEACVDIGQGRILFVGEDNIWLYDGARPVPIAQDLRQWLYNDISATYKYRTIATYDRNNGRVWIFYPSTVSSGNPDSAVVYHIETGRWGRANRTVEAVFNYVTPGLTWDTLNSLSSTWDALPDIPWDSQTWQAAGRAVAVFNTSHVLQTLTGGAEDSGLTTGDFGDDEQATFVRSVRLRFFTAPTTSTITGQTRASLGDSGTAGGSGTYSNKKYDIRQTANWHRFAFQFTGNVEVSGANPHLVPAGKRATA